MMRLQLQVLAWIGLLGKLCRAATIDPGSIFITEVVDPKDFYLGRYVELSADGANEGDVIGGSDFYLKLSSNSNAYFGSELLLSGATFGPGGFLVVCRSLSDFATHYPSESCDVESASVINANGNDAYALVLGSATGSSSVGAIGTIHDIFGEVGAGSAFFTDSQAERNVAGPSSTFDVADWTIEADAYVADITPRVWDVSATDDVIPTISPAPSVSNAPSSTPSELSCTSIQDIQGNDVSSPLSGEDVTVCLAYLTKVKSNGFYLQEVPTIDSSYSSGIFVYYPSHTFGDDDEGTHVIVSGRVSEYYGMTQISGSSVTVGDLADVSFTPVDLILPIDDFERFESMVVSLKRSDCGSDIVISEYYNFDRYGEVKLCSQPCDLLERPFQYTELNKPSVEGFTDHEILMEHSCLFLDDGISAQNPDPALLGGLFEVNQEWNFRGGDIINKLEGPLSYSFGKWYISPQSESDLEVVDSPNSRDVPSIAESDITMAFSNLKNYWTTVGTSSDLRGADSTEEFERQSAKTVLALSMLDVDFIAVCEVENVLEASQDLVDKLNLSSSRTYSAASYAVDTPGVVGGDVIKVDILYDSDKYDLLGVATLTDADVDSEILSMSTTGNIFDGSSRVPLAATFESKESGGIVTIVPNHFKSKGSYGDPPAGGDADINDGAAHYSLMRTLSSKALVTWLSTFPTGVKNTNTIICGDLNAYSQEDAISKLKKTYYSVIDFQSSPPPYTYVFDGQLGSLDYIFVSKDSRRFLQLEDASIWHVNTDEPDIIDYDLNYGRNAAIFDPTIPYRFSDHDVVLASFSFGCGDSETWYWKNKNKDCEWVAASPTDRCNKVNKFTKEKAKVACPLACGRCMACVDDSTWVHKNGRDCTKFAKNFANKKKCRWVAMKNCPKACGRCV